MTKYAAFSRFDRSGFAKIKKMDARSRCAPGNAF
jgi:hypothetical protein